LRNPASPSSILKTPLLALGAGLLGLALLTGCGSSDDSDSGSDAAAGGSVARVNGEEISREDFDEQMEFARSTYQQQGVAFPTGLALAELEQQVVEQMIQQQLVLAEADERNIDASDDEVDSKYRETVESFGDQYAFEQALAAEGLSEDELGDLFRDNIRIEKLLAGVISDAALPPPSEEELQAIYNEYTQQGGTDTFENVRTLLEGEAKSRKENAVVLSFVEELQAAADIEILLNR
jgi:parvulin-like peptidyl-prolyl isomerase